MVAAGFDLVVTISTPSLQTVAKANSSERVIQVFGIVADPFRVGVGIGRKSPLDHPKRLVGVPTPLPVAESFRLARKLFPGLQSVGVVWNPSEANSEITTMQAREICQELRINLKEIHVDSSVAVAEAAAALTAQGVQAIWVGGDNTVLLALDSVIAAARKARIPVFSAVPIEPNRGTLFDIGTNFYDAGRMTGKMAAEILGGVDPATIPIPDKIPQKLVVNKQALKGLKDPWVFPEESAGQGGCFHRRETRSSWDIAGRHTQAARRTSLQNWRGLLRPRSERGRLYGGTVRRAQKFGFCRGQEFTGAQGARSGRNHKYPLDTAELRQ